jgi:Domain of unknown function (DUF1707).
MTEHRNDGRPGGPGGPAPSPDELRIGDAERDEVMAALREHYAQGRLTADELDERLERTLTARTRGDLRQITADLPGAAGTVPEARQAGPWGPGGHGPWDGPWRETQTAWQEAWQAARRHHPAVHHHHAPWARGPHGHRHHPPFPVALVVMLGVIGILAGPPWPPFLALKLLVIGAVVFAVARHMRRRNRRPHHTRG